MNKRLVGVFFMGCLLFTLGLVISSPGLLLIGLIVFIYGGLYTIPK